MSGFGETDDGVNRRQVLKSAAGAGSICSITLGATNVVGAVNKDDTIKIITVKAGEEIRETKNVPADWWRFEQRAEKVKSQLQAKYESVPSIEGVSLGKSNEFVSGRNKSSVTVQVNPETGTSEPVPESIDDVPVKVVDAIRPEPHGCYPGPFDYVPGAADVYGGGGGSATCPVTLSDGTKGLMTCAHAWDDCSNTLYGKQLKQNGQIVGDIETYSHTQDWAVATMNSDSEISGFNNTIVNTGRELSGRVTYDGLKDLKSSEETVYHKGRIDPCESEGLVKSLDESVGRCCDDEGNCTYKSWSYVGMSTPTERGDSGGPHYKTYNYNGKYYAAIIAPHHGEGKYSVGCGAYRIHDEYDIQFQI